MLDLITIEAEERDQTIDKTLKMEDKLRRRAITRRNTEIEWLYSGRGLWRRMESEATASGMSAAHIGDGTEKLESLADMKEGGHTEM